MVILPWPPASLSPNKRLHWAAKVKIKSAYKLECWAIAKSSIPFLPQGNIHLHIVFHPPSKRGFDLDNALASMKVGLDGVAEAWHVNDKMFRPITIDFGDVVSNGCVKISVIQ